MSAEDRFKHTIAAVRSADANDPDGLLTLLLPIARNYDQRLHPHKASENQIAISAREYVDLEEHDATFRMRHRRVLDLTKQFMLGLDRALAETESEPDDPDLIESGRDERVQAFDSACEAAVLAGLSEDEVQRRMERGGFHEHATATAVEAIQGLEALLKCVAPPAGRSGGPSILEDRRWLTGEMGTALPRSWKRKDVEMIVLGVIWDVEGKKLDGLPESHWPVNLKNSPNWR